MVHDVEGTTNSLNVAGAWRLWCEHGGSSEHVQGKKLNKFNTTNPDHVFEIHPLTKVNTESLLATFIPIEGYKTKDAENAFTVYENRKCEVIPNSVKNTTTIVTGMAGYNYVEFIMELNQEPINLADGKAVMASVHDLQDDLLVRNRRMIFVNETPPEKELRGMKEGDKMHVLGIPRINLALVSWRARNSAERPEVSSWSLPYEIIIVAVYK